MSDTDTNPDVALDGVSGSDLTIDQKTGLVSADEGKEDGTESSVTDGNETGDAQTDGVSGSDTSLDAQTDGVSGCLLYTSDAADE